MSLAQLGGCVPRVSREFPKAAMSSGEFSGFLDSSSARKCSLGVTRNDSVKIWRRSELCENEHFRKIRLSRCTSSRLFRRQDRAMVTQRQGARSLKISIQHTARAKPLTTKDTRSTPLSQAQG